MPHLGRVRWQQEQQRRCAVNRRAEQHGWPRRRRNQRFYDVVHTASGGCPGDAPPSHVDCPAEDDPPPPLVEEVTPQERPPEGQDTDQPDRNSPLMYDLSTFETNEPPPAPPDGRYIPDQDVVPEDLVWLTFPIPPPPGRMTGPVDMGRARSRMMQIARGLISPGWANWQRMRDLGRQLPPDVSESMLCPPCVYSAESKRGWDVARRQWRAALAELDHITELLCAGTPQPQPRDTHSSAAGAALR
eukprot:TRINITY_DN13865_c0_g1_i2.p1 TRINITY_DN13865_c0_g1~~TRINITY_DN13865_c0_g1_i2.p1  ORF type:complete len:271 (+),score=34.71 TRINITY_DN13865_c0_g1_i2:79-813(+)